MGFLAHLGVSIENVALGATELMGVFAEVAGEKELAVLRVRVDRMLLEEVLGTLSTFARASEAVNDLAFFFVWSATHFGNVGSLIGMNTGSLFDVENQSWDASHFEGSSFVTVDEFVAYIGIRMVEKSIGSGTFGINIWSGSLSQFPPFAIYILRQNTFFPVANGVIKDETILTQYWLVLTLFAQEIQITLVFRGEKPIGFRARKGVRRSFELVVFVILIAEILGKGKR